MNPADLLTKAERAVASARLLRDAGDIDGACNRAYYAMFEAARASMLTVEDHGGRTSRTHAGLIAAFSVAWSRRAESPSSMVGHSTGVEELRRIADYRSEALDPTLVTWAVEQADAFVAAVRRTIASPQP